MRVGSEPRSIVINPITNKIYVANYLSNTVTVIDGNKRDRVIASIKVGRFPSDIALDPARNIIYVSNEGRNSVSVVDGQTNRVKSNFTIGLSPTELGINPITNTI